MLCNETICRSSTVNPNICLQSQKSVLFFIICLEMNLVGKHLKIHAGMTISLLV